MRRRLTTIYVVLLVCVLASLEVPLAMALCDWSTQRMALDRLADATRFATLAEPALRTGETDDLNAELLRYGELYGIRAVVVDRDHRVVAAGIGAMPVGEDAPPAVRLGIRRAIGGEQFGAQGPIWPWRDDPLVVAAPVVKSGEILGAVVTLSPTDAVRARTRDGWLLLGLAGLLAVAAGIAAASWLASWSLRPVTQLDKVVHDITAGDHAARVPARAGPTELRRLAVAFNEMADTVTDALDRQRAFVAHASHQLRNPLTALRLRVEDLGEEMTTGTGRAEHKLALEETDRLARILDGLLALARAEHRRYHVEPVDATGTAASRVAAWRPLAEQRGIKLRYTPCSEPVTAHCVSTALDQTLDALIDNSLKFAGAGATVTVSVVRCDGGVAVHVTDDGPGLTDEQRRQAKERFWRAPDTQNIDGSGLGLPIVTVLLEASGGRLTLLPAEPHGLDASIWLPGGDAGKS